MQQIQEAVQFAVRELYNLDVEVELTRPNEQFGDYSTNIAMQLSKQLQANPRDIALSIVARLSHPSIADAQVAGPGFINFTLPDHLIFEATVAQPDQPLKGKKILVEYSDPNPFKPLHAGHLYTTIVGDAIASLIETVGANVTRLNYGGDVGLHVGKTMWAILETLDGEYPHRLGEIPADEQAAWLGARYVEGNTAYETDDEARAEIIEINKRVYKLHEDNDHDSQFAIIYWTCRRWSYEYFEKLYKELGVKPFDRFIPESEVTPLGLTTVKQQLARGVFEESDGAVVFAGEKYGLHTRVFINSEGLPTYETKDVGLSLTKWQEYKADQSIIITASEQAQYMQVVMKAIEQFAPEAALRTMHLTHGVVKLSGGVKMSSRAGNVVTAMEIIEAATSAAKESKVGAEHDTILAAIKHAFIKNRIGGDIVYDPSESVALEGNSGPYLQYAHARARSIIRRAEGWNPNKNRRFDDLEPDERSLARLIGRYPETVLLAADELLPHHIANYLYDLSQAFNRFYERNRVIGHERQDVRLHLVYTYAERLRQGLGILGIVAPDKM